MSLLKVRICPKDTGRDATDQRKAVPRSLKELKPTSQRSSQQGPGCSLLSGESTPSPGASPSPPPTDTGGAPPAGDLNHRAPTKTLLTVVPSRSCSLIHQGTFDGGTRWPGDLLPGSSSWCPWACPTLRVVPPALPAAPGFCCGLPSFPV